MLSPCSLQSFNGGVPAPRPAPASVSQNDGSDGSDCDAANNRGQAICPLAVRSLQRTGSSASSQFALNSLGSTRNTSSVNGSCYRPDPDLDLVHFHQLITEDLEGFEFPSAEDANRSWRDLDQYFIQGAADVVDNLDTVDEHMFPPMCRWASDSMVHPAKPLACGVYGLSIQSRASATWNSTGVPWGPVQMHVAEKADSCRHGQGLRSASACGGFAVPLHHAYPRHLTAALTCDMTRHRGASTRSLPPKARLSSTSSAADAYDNRTGLHKGWASQRASLHAPSPELSSGSGDSSGSDLPSNASKRKPFNKLLASTAPAAAAGLLRLPVARKPTKKSAEPVYKSPNRTVPTFSDVVSYGLFKPGSYTFAVGNIEQVDVVVEKDGVVTHAGTGYSSISSFALVVLKSRNPDRRACDGWKEVRHNGVRMEVLRQECLRMMFEQGAL